MGRGWSQDVEDLAREESGQLARAAIAGLGIECYEVGGSVRAALLGKSSPDIDVCLVGANYDELVSRCEARGLRIEDLRVGDVAIGGRVYGPLFPPEGIELALARREESVGNSHTDFLISPGKDISLQEDLLRRDFTCNAIARPILADGTLGELIDPFGGADDIKNGVLRATSQDTISEDPLRILRGLVRMAEDGLIPDSATKQAMIDYSINLRPEGPLPAERIWKELDKIISAPDAERAFRFMIEADEEATIWKNVFPELARMPGFVQNSRYHALSLDEHSLGALEIACKSNYPKEVRWAALLHDCGKPDTAWLGDDGFFHYYKSKQRPGSENHEQAGAEIARSFLQRMRAPKNIERDVPLLIKEHMFRSPEEGRAERAPLRARRLIKRVGRDNMGSLLQLRRCDHGSKGKREEEWLPAAKSAERLIERQSKNPLLVSELKISGDYITAKGIEGPEVGLMLDRLLQRVISNPEDNTPDRLEAWADKMIARQKDLQDKSSSP